MKQLLLILLLGLLVIGAANPFGGGYTTDLRSGIVLSDSSWYVDPTDSTMTLRTKTAGTGLVIKNTDGGGVDSTIFHFGGMTGTDTMNIIYGDTIYFRDGMLDTAGFLYYDGVANNLKFHRNAGAGTITIGAGSAPASNTVFHEGTHGVDQIVRWFGDGTTGDSIQGYTSLPPSIDLNGRMTLQNTLHMTATLDSIKGTNLTITGVDHAEIDTLNNRGLGKIELWGQTNLLMAGALTPIDTLVAPTSTDHILKWNGSMWAVAIDAGAGVGDDYTVNIDTVGDGTLLIEEATNLVIAKGVGVNFTHNIDSLHISAYVDSQAIALVSKNGDDAITLKLDGTSLTQSAAGLTVGADAILASHINAAGVGNSELAVGAVQSNSILDQSIDSLDLSPNSVLASELADNSVASLNIITQAIGKDDIDSTASFVLGSPSYSEISTVADSQFSTLNYSKSVAGDSANLRLLKTGGTMTGGITMSGVSSHLTFSGVEDIIGVNVLDMDDLWFSNAASKVYRSLDGTGLEYSSNTLQVDQAVIATRAYADAGHEDTLIFNAITSLTNKLHLVQGSGVTITKSSGSGNDSLTFSAAAGGGSFVRAKGGSGTYVTDSLQFTGLNAVTITHGTLGPVDTINISVDLSTYLTAVDAGSDITTGTLPVARGGTGAINHTSGEVLVGAGPGAVTTVQMLGSGDIVRVSNSGLANPVITGMTVSGNITHSGTMTFTGGAGADLTGADSVDIAKYTDNSINYQDIEQGGTAANEVMGWNGTDWESIPITDAMVPNTITVDAATTSGRITGTQRFSFPFFSPTTGDSLPAIRLHRSIIVDSCVSVCVGGTSVQWNLLEYTAAATGSARNYTTGPTTVAGAAESDVAPTFDATWGINTWMGIVLQAVTAAPATFTVTVFYHDA